jgi:hypothetical protein
MRLLQLDGNGFVSLTDYVGDNVPEYAILSHTWGRDNEEITLAELMKATRRSESISYPRQHNSPGSTKEIESEAHETLLRIAAVRSIKNKAGYEKIRFCGQQAAKDGIHHFWVDSCCIDKSSSAELTEAINSMFRWYQEADKCYVYLSDVFLGPSDSPHAVCAREGWKSAFERSRWFTRGWTLQELLAPRSVEFFSKEEVVLGNRDNLCAWLSTITSIPINALQREPMAHFTVEERLSWAANRQTQRPEDKAYALLGIFGIFMPLIYGEGEPHASQRLRTEIERAQEVEGAQNTIQKHQQTLLKSLQFEQMTSRQSAIRGAHDATCRWLLQDPTYLDWLEPARIHQHRNFLWIKGKAGSGKSTIMKFAHRKLLSSVAKHPTNWSGITGKIVGRVVATPVVVAFFFTARGTSIERSTIGMYRSLLAQLLEVPLFLQHVLGVLPFPVLQLKAAYCWNIEMLQELLRDLVLGVKLPITCFIDALDECEEGEIRAMLYYLERVVSLAQSSGIEFKICLASRLYPHISLRRVLELILHEREGHKQDIVSYIRAELRSDLTSYTKQIRHDLQRRSSGIFMWVVLVVSILNQLYDSGASREERRLRLQEIPDDLQTLLRDILTRDTRDKDQLAFCIEWVLFATYPLSPEELYYAIQAGQQLARSSEWDEDDMTYEKICRFILNCSKGLVEVTVADYPKTQFIHESVRDLFLQGDAYGRDLVWPDIHSNFMIEIHKRLYQRCLKYLSVGMICQPRRFETSHPTPSAGEPRFKAAPLGNFPFLGYAVPNMFSHARESGLLGTAGELTITKKFSDVTRLQRFSVPASVSFGEHFQSCDLSMIYTVATFKESELLVFAHIVNGGAEYLRVFVQDSASGDLGRKPTSANSAFGPDLIYRKSGKHALSYLTEYGDTQLVRVMVQIGQFDVSCRDQDGNTPLFWALSGNREDVVNQLLDVGANSNTTCAISGNILQFAIFECSEQMVRLLIERGANPHAQGGHYGNALQAAIVKHSEPLVRYLLGLGVDVNKRSGAHVYPLYVASAVGKENLVNLLLDHGADINARGGHYGSALKAANSERIVKLLRARGATLQD